MIAVMWNWEHGIMSLATGKSRHSPTTYRILTDISIVEGQVSTAIAHIIFRDNRILALIAPIETTHERNAVVREVVGIYQQNAHLYRTAISEPEEIWLLYPEAIALVTFPHYTPADIISAAKYKSYLPPGISRHIIHGRALRVNFPMSILLDTDTRLLTKNEILASWLQEKLSKRAVRYYAEATYQFDE